MSPVMKKDHTPHCGDCAKVQQHRPVTQGATGVVSVIIPTYRRPEQVRAAAESALAQTWAELEVLIIADGPDPQTRAAVQGLDPRLRYLELPENAGPAAARNAGVRASHGQWLAFLDDDDLMLPGRIEAQMQFADPTHPWRMISSRAIYKRGAREDIWPERPIAPGEDVAEYLLCRPALLGRPGVILMQTLLLHRSVVEQVPFTTHQDHEDWAWLLEAWHIAVARVVFVWEPLVIYNIDVDAASRSRRVNWQDSLAWAEQYRHWIGDRAFCSFLSTKAALKAKRAGSWHGLRTIARSMFRAKPTMVYILFLVGIAMLPGAALQAAWKRSLQSGREKGAPWAPLSGHTAHPES